MNTPPKRIITREQFQELAAELGVRADWHEPDEQEVEARAFGQSFDNAGFWGANGTTYRAYEEMHIALYRQGEPVALVNLATLCAWASEPSAPSDPPGPQFELEEAVAQARAAAEGDSNDDEISKLQDALDTALRLLGREDLTL